MIETNIDSPEFLHRVERDNLLQQIIPIITLLLKSVQHVNIFNSVSLPSRLGVW